MADIETAEFLIDESLLKLSVERLMFICNFLEMAKDCYMRKSNITIIKKIISKSKITDLRHWNFCTNCNQDIENFCRREQDQKLILIY